MSRRVRKDDIVMHHMTPLGEDWWQAERDGIKSSWFRKGEGKSGYQRAIDDLLTTEAARRIGIGYHSKG